MASENWNWAKLSDKQLNEIRDAEKTLGGDVDILLAYQGNPPGIRGMGEGTLPKVNLEIASINNSQVECLQGLEKKLDVILVAYHNPGRSS